MAERDGIWSRGGVPVEELPDPFAAEAAAAEPTLPSEPSPSRREARRRWPIYLYSIAGADAVR